MSVVDSVLSWGRMVKLSHSVFALPFALASASFAAARHGISPGQLVWIVVAMLAARNAAMGFNRLADQQIDARNPRTRQRELPAGRLQPAAVWTLTLCLAALFVFAAFRLGPLCGWLSPVALAVIFGYSYTKRFTWASHAVLGLSLAMAPVGAWLAVTGQFSAVAWSLGAAVITWVAGFDVIYACQDSVFDREAGLHSIPARFGVGRALAIARGLHVLTLLLLALVGWLAGAHPVYWVGWVGISAAFVWEHRLVDADDLSRLDVAFFTMNGVIAVLYLAVVLLAVLLGSG